MKVDPVNHSKEIKPSNPVVSEKKTDDKVSSTASKIFIILAVVFAIPTLGLSLLIPAVVYLVYNCCKKIEGIDSLGRSKIMKDLAELESKASKGDVASFIKIAQIYDTKSLFSNFNNNFNIKDDHKAFSYYEKAALSNDKKYKAEGLLKVAQMYEEGRGVTRNADEAFKYYQLLLQQPEELQLLAPAGIATAHYKIGIAYEKGEVTEKDATQALEHYEKAAKKTPAYRGLSEAHLKLAQIYINGTDTTEKNLEKAIEHVEVIKNDIFYNQNKHELASVFYKIGNHYQNEDNISLAFDYYSKSYSKEANKDVVKEIAILVGNQLKKQFTNAQFEHEKITTFGDFLDQMQEPNLCLRMRLKKHDRSLDWVLGRSEPIGLIPWEIVDWNAQPVFYTRSDSSIGIAAKPAP